MFYIFYLSITSFIYAFLPLEAKVGDIFPKEWKKKPAIAKDYEVIQLTNAKATSTKMYLNVNPYVEKLNSIVFTSDRQEGRFNLYLLSLKTGKITQITDVKDMEKGHSNISGKALKAFFAQKMDLKAVSLEPPYRQETFYKSEQGFKLNGDIAVREDGKGVAVIIYNKNEQVSKVIYIDTATKSATTLVEEKQKISHLVFNPQGDKFFYSCPKNIKVFDLKRETIIDITTKKGRPIHYFWFSDGERVGYAVKDNLENTLSSAGVGIYDLQKNEQSEYFLEKYSNHMAVNPSGTLLVGDGSPAQPFIYFYPIDDKAKVLYPKKICKHGSSSSEQLVHTHGIFINETDFLFNSDEAGHGNIYLLRKKG